VSFWFAKGFVEDRQTLVLCLFAATFDAFLLLIRWMVFDQPSGGWRLISGICQLYRVLVVPIADTWITWQVLYRLEYQLDFGYIILLAILLFLCILVGTQVSPADPDWTLTTWS